MNWLKEEFRRARKRSAQIPPFARPTYTRHPAAEPGNEPHTLDNTSQHLVVTLRFLIDEYGLTGVRRALDLIEDREGASDARGD